MPIRVIIKTGYTCNNNCIFCHARYKRKYPDLTLNDIKEKISKAKEFNADMIILSGGEPTIRKDFFLITDFIKRNDLKLGLITNGRMLCYEEFLHKLYKYGLRYVYVSLHGSNERVHNKLTRTESFKQTLGGIKNVSGIRSVELVVNCVITKYNLNDMEKIIDMLKGIRIDKIKFSFTEPVNNFQIIANIKTASLKAINAIEHGKKMGLNIAIDGFPLCLIKKYEKNIDNLKTNKIRYISESYETDFFPSDYGNTTKLKLCQGCSKINNCLGLFKRYLELNQEQIQIEPFRKRI